MPLLRRIMGLGLLAAAYAPFHRLLDPAHTGPAGETTRRVVEGVWGQAVWGTVLVAGAAALATVLVAADPAPSARRLMDRLCTVPGAAWALACAALALVLSATVAFVLFGALPTSVDEMVQLTHAEVLRTGVIAWRPPGDAAPFMVQNSLVTARGWASVYPPLHTLLLAVGLAGGAAWLVGPLATAMAVATFTLGLDRLVPHRPGVVRCAGLLVATSPFVILMGGTHLSHTSAAAMAGTAFWTALKARDGGTRWSMATGAAVGAFVCARPWTGLVLSGALLASLWLPLVRLRGGRWMAVRAGGLVAGGAPFAALLMAWNHALFGSPLRLGYSAAFGPSHGLGLHTDPWGNRFGIVESVGYSGADLLHLGMALFETPVPALALVGAALAAGRLASRETTPLLAWALGGVAANALYWHHGMHMGPRLLYETAPAWIALCVVAAADLTEPDSGLPPRLRRGVVWAVGLSLAAAAVLAPQKAMAFGGSPVSRVRLVGPGDGPALIFAHGSWSSRVVARLTAAGMRRDSVETAIRRNDLCAVDRYASWRTADGAGVAPTLDFSPLPGRREDLSPVTLSPGNVAWLRGGAVLSGACLREARSDREGSVELEPLLWQAHPRSGGEVVVARDMGPGTNAEVMADHPGRAVWVLTEAASGGWRLLPYDTAMGLLWGGPDVSPDVGGS
jgi:hypothetical protein